MKYFIQLLLLLFILSVITPARAADLGGRYRLSIDPGNPNRGLMRLSLNEPLTVATSLSVRLYGEASPVIVRCDNVQEPLLQKSGQWLAPKGCIELSWEVSFETIDDSYDVSRQINIYHPKGWWLLSEWGTILRLDGVFPAQVCVELQTKLIECRNLPPTNEAPLFFPFGRVDERFRIRAFTFNFFLGNDHNGIELGDLHTTLAEQLDYLSSLSGLTKAAVGGLELDIVWLGIAKDNGVVSGAAGSSAFLANYAFDDVGVSPQEVARLLWISGHELSHLLGVASILLWAGESLGHYYGFKSLTINNNEVAQQLFDEMVSKISGSTVGLLEAHERVRRGESEYYGLFYSKGAAFWRALDQAIRGGSCGDRDLDYFLPLLTTPPFAQNGDLPAEFAASVGKCTGPVKLKRLFADYL